MYAHLLLFGSAATGATLQEAIWWYNLRLQLSNTKYRRLFRSPSYWLVTAAFIALTGVAALFWYSDQPNVPGKEVILLGAAMPLLLKQGIKTGKPEQHLGAEPIGFWAYLS